MKNDQITQDQVLQMELACEMLVERAVFAPSTMALVLKSYWRAMEALQQLAYAKPFEPDARREAEAVLHDAEWRIPLSEEMN